MSCQFALLHSFLAFLLGEIENTVIGPRVVPNTLSKDSNLSELTDNFSQTAALLFSEYICLAIMSFPYSYSVLGLVPGLIITVAVAMSVLYTSLTVWCVRN